MRLSVIVRVSGILLQGPKAGGHSNSAFRSPKAYKKIALSWRNSLRLPEQAGLKACPTAISHRFSVGTLVFIPLIPCLDGRARNPVSLVHPLAQIQELAAFAAKRAPGRIDRSPLTVHAHVLGAHKDPAEPGAAKSSVTGRLGTCLPKPL